MNDIAADIVLCITHKDVAALPPLIFRRLVLLSFEIADLMHGPFEATDATLFGETGDGEGEFQVNDRMRRRTIMLDVRGDDSWEAWIAGSTSRVTLTNPSAIDMVDAWDRAV